MCPVTITGIKRDLFSRKGEAQLNRLNLNLALTQWKVLTQ